MAERDIEEVFIGRDSGRQYFRVRDTDAGDMAADEHEAIVLVASNVIQCYRCDRKADIEFKCIHIHTVRRALNL